MRLWRGGGGEDNCVQGLVGKPVENGPLTWSRLRCEDYSKWNLKPRVGGCEWIDLAEDWDRLRAAVQTLKNFGCHN